jgi:hypothetical protein
MNERLGWGRDPCPPALHWPRMEPEMCDMKRRALEEQIRASITEWGENC